MEKTTIEGKPDIGTDILYKNICELVLSSFTSSKTKKVKKENHMGYPNNLKTNKDHNRIEDLIQTTIDYCAT